MFGNQRPAAPWSFGNWWGQYGVYGDLPNVAGSSFQIPQDVQAGDIAWVIDTGALYVCTDPTQGAAVWDSLGLAGLSTLQDAYDGGNDITIAAATPLIFQSGAETVPVLQIIRSNTGTGCGITIANGSNATGCGINITQTNAGHDPSINITHMPGQPSISMADGTDAFDLNASAARGPVGSLASPTYSFSGYPTSGWRLDDSVAPTLQAVLEGASALTIRGQINEATGDEIGLEFTPTINKATSGNYTALRVNSTETSAPGTANKLLELAVGGIVMASIDTTGNLVLEGTGAAMASQDGTAAAPSLTFANETSTGIYLADASTPTIGIAVEGGALVTGKRLLDAATGNEVAYEITPTINKATSGDYTAWRLDVTETLAPGSDNILATYEVDAAPKMQLRSDGILSAANSIKVVDQFPVVTTYADLSPGTGDGALYYAKDKLGSGFVLGQQTPGNGEGGTDLYVIGGDGGNTTGLAAAISGGVAYVQGGWGGAGDGTYAAGAGGDATLVGGGAGTDNGGGGANGGDVTIDAGAATGAGTNGVVSVGETNASAIASGNGTGITWTHNGILAVAPNATAAYQLQSNGIRYEAGIASFDILSNTAAVMAIATPVDIVAGTGGATDGVSQAEWGGILSLSGGDGGDGDATQLPGGGGDVYLLGGRAGADGGAGPEASGSAYVDGGTSQSGGAAGSVYIGTTEAVAINSGHGASGIVWTHSGQFVLDKVGTAAAPGLRLDRGSGNQVGLHSPADNQLALAANSESLIVDNDDTVPSFRADVDSTWTLGETAIAWANVYADAVTLINGGTPSIVISGSGGTIQQTGQALLEINHSAAVATVSGQKTNVRAQAGGATSGGADDAAVGGDLNLFGGVGGDGDATYTGKTGGAALLQGGTGGANNGGGGGDGGPVYVRGGPKTGVKTDGDVYIGDTQTNAVILGASGVTTSVTGPLSAADTFYTSVRALGTSTFSIDGNDAGTICQWTGTSTGVAGTVDQGTASGVVTVVLTGTAGTITFAAGSGVTLEPLRGKTLTTQAPGASDVVVVSIIYLSATYAIVTGDLA